MEKAANNRLAIKTLEQRFRHELESGFEFAPRIAQGVLDTAKEIFHLNTVPLERHHRLRPGQIRQILAVAEAPHGCPLEEIEMVEVTWTVDAGAEDKETLAELGRVGLRQKRILRLIDEALEQGGEPTQEDLGKALGVTARTIRSDIATLKKDGHQIATRGKLRGVGRGQTHKAFIVELYLQRYTYTEIKRRSRHSIRAIKRYIQTFGRVIMLKRKGMNVSEIAFSINITEKLATEYLALYREYDIPKYQARLTEIIQRVSGRVQSASETPKRGAK